jgi:hypothetical protein
VKNLTPPSVTLTIAANFPYPFGTATSQLELRHMFNSGLGEADPNFEFWEPSVVDFQAVSGATLVVGTFNEFLGKIQSQPPGSIVRINLISHGGSGKIAFGGTIDVAKSTVWLNDVLSIGDLIATPLSATVKTLQNRFAANAQIVFFMCRAGADVGMLKEIADAFGVTVKGFHNSFFYCPTVMKNPNGTFTLQDRKRVGTGGCDGQMESNILTWIPDVSASPPAAAPAPAPTPP